MGNDTMFIRLLRWWGFLFWGDQKVHLGNIFPAITSRNSFMGGGAFGRCSFFVAVAGSIADSEGHHSSLVIISNG
ncbi:hypothetical protein [Anaerophaga thermohalophila]|uniref:hypothetical protein n=1 Tax=Anaerophaga thermohalophila TaxID=177400 RepID=UPI000237CE6F|nr:hypothetical protein [Anaerophaga thermohalophila]